MPAAEDDFPDFDDLESQTVPTHSLPIPAQLSSKKSKKKTKKHARPKLEDDEETPYPKSVTPSPPADHGVRIQQASPPPVLVDDHFELAEPRAPTPPPPVDFDDDTTVYEDPEPVPEPIPPPAKGQLPPAAALSSPRPQPAKPASNTTSPVPRYAVPTVNRASPQTGHTVPYGSPGQYGRLGGYAPDRPRRESFATQSSQRPRMVNPPPPHMPQAHFWGLPNLGFDYGPKPKTESGKPAGSDRYCCSFDTFADAGDAASTKKATDALLVGEEGGLYVYRVLPTKMEVVGRLEGLRGGVIGAKILPWTEKYDAIQAQRPLVAVIVHGAILDDRRDSGAADPPSHYQTTVEIYSLQSQQHVATLYKSVPIPIDQPALGHLASLPEPIGDLRIDAQGRFIIVSSGKSGEIFVFAQNSSTDSFLCIGKYWTALQVRFDTPSRPTSSTETGQTTSKAEERSTAPLLSLSPRWLATVPPPTASKISIQGTPLLLEDRPAPPGLTSHAAPAQPPVSCDIMGLDAEGMLGRLSRQGAQNLMKASQKAFEMARAGWKELNYPSSPEERAHATSDEASAFPPTHASLDDQKRLAKEPALVSIVDLERLDEAALVGAKHVPPPLATFALTEGCNYLSFSPSGLRLMTSSRKGEVSTIWVLAQAAHGSSKDGADDGETTDTANGPSVRHILRIPRSSQSIVLDSTWSRDGDMLALLTAHGTVHLHEVPMSATSRKRKRQSISSAPALEKAEPTVSVSQGLSPPSSNGFLGNMKSTWQNVSTQVNAVRSGNTAAAWGVPTSFAGFKQATSAARDAGGRMLATGTRQVYCAAKSGASDFYHADDNKIRRKELCDNASHGCLRWVRNKGETSLVIVCGGKVHLHPVQRVTRQRGDAMITGLKHEKAGHKDFALPFIATARDLSSETRNGCADQGPHGYWILRHSQTAGIKGATSGMTKVAPAQANEVETNPPYCPFHVDKRVSLYAYTSDDHEETLLQGHGLDDEVPWAFGEPMPSSRKLNERTPIDATDFTQGIEDEDLDNVADAMESKLTIQPAGRHSPETLKVNTRRRRKKRDLDNGDGERPADGGFEILEDDDDSLM